MGKTTKKNKDEATDTKKYRRQNIYFNSSNDDLYEHFQKQNDKTSYIMKLIRKDLEESESSEQNLIDLKSDIQDLKLMMIDVLNKLDNVSIVETETKAETYEPQLSEVKQPSAEEEVKKEIENPGLSVNSEYSGLLLDVD